MVKKCGECGKEFEPEGDGAFCLPCEFEIQAAEPPESLRDARHIWGGHEAGTPAQRMLKRMMDMKPGEFWRELQKQEKEYRLGLSAKKKGKSVDKVEPAAVEEPDESGERALELWERLKKEWS